MRTLLLGLAACLLGLTLSGTVQACGRGWGGCGRGWGGCGWGRGYSCGYGGYRGWGGYGGYSYGYGGWGGYSSPAYYGGMIGYSVPVGATSSAVVSTQTATRATLVVHLPADATLLVEGKPTTAASQTRTFVSPPLEPGYTYSYTLEARMKQGDKTVVAKEKVTVRAGQTSEAQIRFPATQVASR